MAAGSDPYGKSGTAVRGEGEAPAEEAPAEEAPAEEALAEEAPAEGESRVRTTTSATISATPAAPAIEAIRRRRRFGRRRCATRSSAWAVNGAAGLTAFPPDVISNSSAWPVPVPFAAGPSGLRISEPQRLQNLSVGSALSPQVRQSRT